MQKLVMMIKATIRRFWSQSLLPSPTSPCQAQPKTFFSCPSGKYIFSSMLGLQLFICRRLGRERETDRQREVKKSTLLKGKKRTLTSSLRKEWYFWSVRGCGKVRFAFTERGNRKWSLDLTHTHTLIEFETHTSLRGRKKTFYINWTSTDKKQDGETDHGRERQPRAAFFANYYYPSLYIQQIGVNSREKSSPSFPTSILSWKIYCKTHQGHRFSEKQPFMATEASCWWGDFRLVFRLLIPHLHDLLKG